MSCHPFGGAVIFLVLYASPRVPRRAGVKNPSGSFTVLSTALASGETYFSQTPSFLSWKKSGTSLCHRMSAVIFPDCRSAAILAISFPAPAE